MKKCADPLYNFHKGMRSSEEFTKFPDPVPFEDDEKVYITMKDLILPSQLQDVSKQPHNLPFTPTAHTAKMSG